MQFSMPSPQELEQLISFCKVMAQSPFYMKMQAGGVMAIYLTAKEYDLPFMACLNGGLHTFDGKVTFSAIMIDALIRKAGHHTEILSLNEDGCTIKFTRGDRENLPDYKPLVFSYTKEMAKTAGYLNKNNWKSSLQDMLYCRALTGGGRKHMPEVFVGVLVQGELIGNQDQDITPLVPVDVSDKIQLPSDQPVSQIEHVPQEDIDKFIELYKPEKGTPIDAFLVTVEAKSHKTRREIIEAAIKSPSTFQRKFNEWTAINYPKESM